MARADRLSRLINEWQRQRSALVSIRDHFAEPPAQRNCVDIAEFGLKVLDRCIAEFQAANYPLDQPQSAGAVDPAEGTAAQEEIARLLLKWRAGQARLCQRCTTACADELEAALASSPAKEPIQLQDQSSAPEWTCPTCGGDVLWCKCVSSPAAKESK